MIWTQMGVLWHHCHLEITDDLEIAPLGGNPALPHAGSRTFNMSGVNPILTCREVIDLLADDWDESLPGSLALKLKLHLFLCRSCRRFRRTYQKTVTVVHALRKAEARFDPGILPEELIRRIMLRRQTVGTTTEAPQRTDIEPLAGL